MQAQAILAEIFNGIFIINLVLAGLLVFFERRNPNSTLSWLMVLLFIPVLGFVLYLFLGQNLRRRKLFILKGSEEDALLRTVYRQKSDLRDEDFNFNDPRTHDYTDLIRLNLISGYATFSQNNTVEVLSSGDEKFAGLTESISKAQTYIHLEYYIIRNDSLGQEIVQLLARKAREGVEVKVLYDGMGCLKLPKNFFAPLLEAGGKTAVFFPPFIPAVNVRVNYRNHRKICIVDGQEAFVGGYNIGNEYRGLSPKFGHWQDLHLKLRGSAVDSLEFRFHLDWRFAAKEDLPLSDLYFPNKNPQGETALQIVTSGPDSQWHTIRNAYLKMVNTARDHIYLETPYFVPDESLLTALKIAGLSGVDVRLIIPSKPDHPFVYWASLSYIGELLETGVRCYTYTKGFMHSKMITADGFMSTVGSANLDIRSFQINFEVNAFVYSETIARRLEEIFLQDMQDSTEITMESYRRRSLGVKTKEAVSRLLSPLL